MKGYHIALFVLFLMLGGKLRAQTFFDSKGNKCLFPSYQEYTSPFLKKKLAYNVEKASFAFYSTKSLTAKATIILLPGSTGLNTIDIESGARYAEALNLQGFNVFLQYYKTDSVASFPIETFVKTIMKPTYQDVKNFNVNMASNVGALKDFVQILLNTPEKLQIPIGQKTGILSTNSAGAIVLNFALQDSISTQLSFITAINPTYIWVTDSIETLRLPPLLTMASTDGKLSLGPNQYISLYKKWFRSDSPVDLRLYSRSEEIGLYNEQTEKSGWFLEFLKWFDYNNK